jgi:hypothetical protein
MEEEYHHTSAQYLAQKISNMGSHPQYTTMSRYVITNNLDADALDSSCGTGRYNNGSTSITSQILNTLQPSYVPKSSTVVKDYALENRISSLVKSVIIENRRSRASFFEIGGLEEEHEKFNGIYCMSDENELEMPIFVHTDKQNMSMSYRNKAPDFVSVEFNAWLLQDALTVEPGSNAGIYIKVKAWQMPESVSRFQGIVAFNGMRGVAQNDAWIAKGEIFKDEPEPEPEPKAELKRERDITVKDEPVDENEKPSKKSKTTSKK